MLKDVKNIKCELYFVNTDWTLEKDIIKTHHQYDKDFPKEALNYSNYEIKKGLEKLYTLQYLDKRIKSD
jgi:hypothetical protein